MLTICLLSSFLYYLLFCIPKTTYRSQLFIYRSLYV